MMDADRLKSKEWLQKAHSISSANKIAQMLGVSNPTVRYWLKKHGIDPHNISTGMLKCSKQLSKRSKEYWSNKSNRIAHSKRLKQTQSKRKKELSASAKKNWKNNRRALLTACRELHTNQNYIAKISTGTKRSWTDERKKLQSDISKSLWTDPEYRVKRAIALSVVTDSDKFRAKVSENSKKMWQQKEYRNKMTETMAATSPVSVLEITTKSILKSLEIESQPISIGPWTFDIYFKYNNRRILIECQGSYWHSLKDKIIRDKQKKTYFDRYLSDKYELYYLHEYEFYGSRAIYFRLLDILSITTEEYQFKLRDLSVNIIAQETANKFFNAYHYLHKGRCGLNLAAYLDKNLIAVASFTGVTRKQTADRLGVDHLQVLELARFCIHPQYHKKNLASWLLARCLKFIPQSVQILIAFSDIGAGHRGTIYKSAGWTYDGQTKPSYWYIDNSGNRYHKKSIWDQSRRLQMGEVEYATKFGLAKCNGLPVLRFIKRLN